MENFIIFLKVLFLGKTILLTPVPIDINNQWLELKLNEPLEAITSGASLEVRFSRQYQLFIGLKDFNDIYEIANESLPEGGIEAELIDENGNKIILSGRVLSFSKDYVSYGLIGNAPLPTSIKFNRIKLKSNIKIEGVEIFWKNYKH